MLETDPATDRVVVGPGELLSRSGLVADRASWIAGTPPSDGPFECEVRVRYQGDNVPAVVEADVDGVVRVEFRRPERAIAPGQSVVFYRRDEYTSASCAFPTQRVDGLVTWVQIGWALSPTAVMLL